jgi:dipeptidase E
VGPGVCKRLLLISNSTQHGRGFLDHVEADLRSFLGEVRNVVFLPFALFDRAAYTARVQARLEPMGYRVDGLEAGSLDLLERAEAVFLGGGNTFRLLKALQDLSLVAVIRRRVSEGIPYVGSSAGSIVACPTLKTTKDMPIVEPASFEALGLVDFQISPHYLDPDPASMHMGETQEERILQFLEENDAAVLGLREGAFVRVEGGSAVLAGTTGARLFRRGTPPAELRPRQQLDDLLAPGAR